MVDSFFGQATHKILPHDKAPSMGIPKGARLTQEQKTKLKEHRKHHTRKHIASMQMAMLKGESFDGAHQAAMKSVGK